jgi:hypothetical protein
VEKQWLCTKLPDVNEHECTKTSSHHTSGFIPFKLAPRCAKDFGTTQKLGPYAPAPTVAGAFEKHHLLLTHINIAWPLQYTSIRIIYSNAAQESVPSN